MPESKSGALTNLATPQRRNRRAPTRALVLPGIRSRHHANAASGCRASVLATNPCIAGGRASAAARASDSEAKGANTQPPEPVIRATSERSRNSASAAAISGNRATATGCEVIAPITRGKDVHFRRRGVTCQILRRENGRGRHDDRRHDDGDPQRGQRDRRQALAHAARLSPAHRKGRRERRLPASIPIRMRSARDRPTPQRRFSASSTEAASELPPPSPAPTGILFATAMSAPSGQPVSRCSAVAARTARSCCAGTLDNPLVRRISPSSRQVSVIVSPGVERDEQRLELVVAVGTTPGDMQEQIELGGRRDGQRAHPSIVAARASPRQIVTRRASDR